MTNWRNGWAVSLDIGRLSRRELLDQIPAWNSLLPVADISVLYPPSKAFSGVAFDYGGFSLCVLTYNLIPAQEVPFP